MYVSPDRPEDKVHKSEVKSIECVCLHPVESVKVILKVLEECGVPVGRNNGSPVYFLPVRIGCNSYFVNRNIEKLIMLNRNDERQNTIRAIDQCAVPESLLDIMLMLFKYYSS